MRLFSIGESVTQGFMSLAAARTELCFSTLVARALGIPVGPDYTFPSWPRGGHPVNLESLLRRLNRFYGPDIFGPLEWPMAIQTIGTFLDDIEDYYERGDGNEFAPSPTNRPYYHNVAVRGFDVADAWMVTPELCWEQIESNTDGSGDGPFATPNAGFYRTALEVLNPRRDWSQREFSALRWLQSHATGESGEEGVENLILWLGSNNVLGTAVELKIKPTRAHGRSPLDMSQPEREPFNLWRPEHFEAEYRELMTRVDHIMRENRATNWRVFVGNVPAITVAPVAKGVGDTKTLDDPFGHLQMGAQYYEYYTYFLFDRDFAHSSNARLDREDALHIDKTIFEYNKSIQALVDEFNNGHAEQRYFIVDINKAFLQAAFKRNNGQPTYQFPSYFNSVHPKPNTKYYHADRNGVLRQGGLFSLDGVHPSAIGQGLLAHEFINAMKAAGVTFVGEIDWEGVFRSDSLWRRPLRIMQELYEHEKLSELIVRFLQRM